MTTTVADPKNVVHTEDSWHETLLRHKLRNLCLHASRLRPGKARAALHKPLDNTTNIGKMVKSTLPELHAAVFSNNDSALMRHVNHLAKVADTLANNRLVKAADGTAQRDMELRYTQLYALGIMLEDLMVELSLFEFAQDDVKQLRAHLSARGLPDGDLLRMGKVFIGKVTEQMFMTELRRLVSDFNAWEGIWAMMKYFKKDNPLPSL